MLSQFCNIFIRVKVGNLLCHNLIVLSVLSFTNYFLFIRRKRYLLIAEQLEKQSSNSSFGWSVVTFLYAILSIISFFIIYSNQVLEMIVYSCFSFEDALVFQVGRFTISFFTLANICIIIIHILY